MLDRSRIKACHIGVGVDLEGRKRVLGMWIEANEGAKFWAGVLTEIRNRGVRNVLIVCCDGLKGLPEAIEATWPQAKVQTCVVHYADVRIMPMWSPIPLRCRGSGLAWSG